MISVRSASPGDAAAWLRMRRALWPEGTAAEHGAEIDRYFAGKLRMPLEVLLAVDDADRPLGFAELSIRAYAEDCTTDRVAFLEGWYVEPHARRRGVGAALVRAAEDWGRSQGCTEFASDALLDNDASAAAHLALGFEETVQIRCFKKMLVALALTLSAATGAEAQQVERSPAPAGEPAAIVARLDTLTAPLARIRDSVVGALAAASPAQADTAYRVLRERLGALTRAWWPDIEGGDVQFLLFPDGHEGYRRRRDVGRPFDRASPGELAGADSVIRHLRTRGVWTLRAEGGAYLVPDEEWVARPLLSRMSSAGIDASRIFIEEQVRPTAEDASIQITPDELAARVVRTDWYVTTYPGTALAGDIARLNRAYLGLFIGGSDNTPAFSRSSRAMHPSFRARLERFALVHEGTASAAVVQEYLAVLRANGFRRTDAVQGFLRAFWNH